MTKTTLVGSLLDDDPEDSHLFGESIETAKRRRMGRRVHQEEGVEGFSVGDESENVRFDDSVFDKAFTGTGRARRPTSQERRAKRELLETIGARGDERTRDRSIRRSDMAALSQLRRKRSGGGLVVDGETGEVFERTAEPDEPEAPRSRRDTLLERLAAVTRALASHDEQDTATTAAEPEPDPIPPDDLGASTVERGPSEGDVLESLADLEASLGISVESHDDEAGGFDAARIYDGIGARAKTEARTTQNDLDAGDDLGDLPPLMSEALATVDDSTPEPSTKGRAYIPPAKTDDHGTPKRVARAVRRTWGDTDLDPAASRVHRTIKAATQYYGPDDPDDPLDGLDQLWSGKVYLNPPYGRTIKDWIDKIVLEVSTSLDVEGVIALLPLRSDVGWFQDDVLDEATMICFVRGRLKFGGSENSAPFPSVVVLFGGEQWADAFRKAFGEDIDEEKKRPIGRVVDLRLTRDAA